MRVLLFRFAVFNGIVRHLEAATTICCASVDELLLLQRGYSGVCVCVVVCCVHTAPQGYAGHVSV